MILNSPTPKDLEYEWEHETIDSLFFSYYPTSEEKEDAKVKFLNHFTSFAFQINLNKEHIESFKYQLYNGNTLEELQENTRYMNKDISIILNKLVKNEIYTPILLFKNNKLEILSGRTRISISNNILKQSINATVIDYEKMMELMYPLKLRMEKFIDIGYDILCLESKSFRRKMCFYLKSNDICHLQ